MVTASQAAIVGSGETAIVGFISPSDPQYLAAVFSAPPRDLALPI